MKDMKDILQKTLVTGSGGALGSYVDFGIKVDRGDFDITDTGKTIEAVKRLKPLVILHMAAETDLAKCEKDPAHAFLVNSVGTYNLALAARVARARMVYISTDDVFSFSGVPHSEEETPEPAKVYGHSKYLGELALRGTLDEDSWLIVRTAWIFGGGKEKDKKFVAKIIGQLNKDYISVVNDQFGSPTFGADLVKTLKQLIKNGDTGLVHVVNDGIASRYDIAAEITALFNSDTRIHQVSGQDLNLPNHSLSSGGLMSKKIKLRSWQEALAEYVKTEWKK